MFLHAAKTASSSEFSRNDVLWARERVAIAQGYRDWGSLRADIVENAAYGAIPVAWIEHAVGLMSTSRRVEARSLPDGSPLH